MNHRKLMICFCCIHSLACVAFFFGFLPLKRNNVEIKNVVYNLTSVPAKYTHFVIVLIDALRTDFVFNEDKTLMPFLQEIIRSNQTYSFKARSKPPTVTMPRLKAFTSGTITDFSELLFNAASNEFIEDNFISAFNNDGKSIVFYGDDTWLKMFPDRFLRSEGTTSFFVSDFFEVDDNITRHIDDELEQFDWNVMVLHYLGLDHIGHAEGPNSIHIRPKLHEMDRIIRTVHRKMIERDNREGSRSLLLVCGDHGMSDAGSHGGASIQEIYTPAVFIDTHRTTGIPLAEYDIEQVDLASTISTLFGLQIPSSSVGKPILAFNELYSQKEYSHIQQLTACQLSAIAEQACDKILVDELVRVCFGHDRNITDIDNLLEVVCNRLQNIHASYNDHLMIFALTLMIISVFLMIRSFIGAWRDVNKRLAFNSNFVLQIRTFEIIFIAISLLCLASTSFIEEEHYIWYYFTSTYFVLLITWRGVNIKKILLILLLLRVARAWNQTGVKWMLLEDITDWFQKYNKTIELTVLIVILHCVVFVLFLVEHWSNIIRRISLLISFVFLLLYRAFTLLNVQSVLINVIVRFMYAFILIMLVLYVLSNKINAVSISVISSLLLLRWENLPWFCMIVLIERLLASKDFFRLHTTFSKYDGLGNVWLYYMLSRFTYFSQGNSNSLSTIDISTGMIGFSTYHPLIATFITYYSTYCGQLFWFASYVDHTTIWGLKAKQKLQLTSTITIYTHLNVSILSCIVYLQRYHLFIWSVFAPKYLYMLSTTLMTAVLSLPIYICLTTELI